MTSPKSLAETVDQTARTAMLTHQTAIRRLSTVLRDEAIPHALLFSGPGGTGKSAAARALAMWCNCAERDGETAIGLVDTAEACPCRSCHKIRANVHPDIHWIAPTGAYIRIDQIRSLCRDLVLKPYEGRYRVTVIADAETMNPEATNALLKMLEEPPPHTVMILLARRKADLLPTILSRCQEVRFAPLPREAVERFLVAAHGLPAEEASAIARLAGGSLESLDSPDGIRRYRQKRVRREWLIRTFAGLLRPPEAENVTLFSLSLAEALCRKKEEATDDLDILARFLRDCLILALAPEKIDAGLLSEPMWAVAEHVPTEALLAMSDAVRTARRRIRANANLRLTLDAMMTAIHQEAVKYGNPVRSSG